MRTILIIAALLAAVPKTEAADVIGNGAASCGEWTSNHRQTDSMSLTDEAWLAGYLSAYSINVANDIDLPDQGARNSWVSNYCRNHPLDMIYMAADQLIDALLKRQSSQR
jgi:hypothetical protein